MQWLRITASPSLRDRQGFHVRPSIHPLQEGKTARSWKANGTEMTRSSRRLGVHARRRRARSNRGHTGGGHAPDSCCHPQRSQEPPRGLPRRGRRRADKRVTRRPLFARAQADRFPGSSPGSRWQSRMRDVPVQTIRERTQSSPDVWRARARSEASRAWSRIADPSLGSG